MCVGLLTRNKFTTENNTFALLTGLCWSEVPKRPWRIILQCFRSLLCVCKLYIHSHSAARPLCFWNPTYLIPKTVPYTTCVFMDVGSWRNVTMPTCLSHLPNPASPKDLYPIPVSWWFHDQGHGSWYSCCLYIKTEIDLKCKTMLFSRNIKWI